MDNNKTHPLLAKTWHCQDFIAHLGNEYPLLSAYESTQQDIEWHAEGNVLIHTDMVLDSVYALFQSKASNLSDREKIILILAACFHDYAKPISTTTREVKGKLRVVAPHHEALGASLLFNLNIPFDLTPQEWLSVIQLTAYHHIPKLLVTKGKERPEYARLARQVPSLELLYLLEYADMTGRTCDDKQEQLDIMDYFKLESDAFGFWGKSPYPFLHNMIKIHFPDKSDNTVLRIADHAMIHYEERRIFMIEEELSIAFNYLEQPHLLLTCGMAGAGKSSYLNKHYPDYHRIELDVIREKVSKGRFDQNSNDEVVRIAHEELKQALRDKRNIIWDATNYRSDFRKRIIDLGVAYGAFTEILAFHKPLSRLITDNNNREHAVPKEDFQKMLTKFQWPEVGEAHRLTLIFN